MIQRDGNSVADEGVTTTDERRRVVVNMGVPRGLRVVTIVIINLSRGGRNGW